jgi:hypothetical protein
MVPLLLKSQHCWPHLLDVLQEKQIDELKTVLLEGNPYFLGLTFAVSLLHSVFDMLAFKNDIGFWRSNKSMEGLSARTIIINAFCQLVIFLYLLDNETSAVVLLSAGVISRHILLTVLFLISALLYCCSGAGPRTKTTLLNLL